jgi:SHS2 domain-containing protein
MTRPGYEIFEHTADVGVRAFGANFAELAVNAARGMFSLVCDPANVRPTITRTVEARADDREELLQVWLKELLCLLDIEGIVLCDFRVIACSATHLKAEVRGEPLDHERHEPDMEVKAVTRHGYEIRETANGLETEIIFDI